MKRIFACKASKVRRHQPACVTLPDGDSAVIFQAESGLFAVQNRCPHVGSTLVDGLVRNDTLTCIWHGWQFDLPSGKCLSSENSRLRKYPLEIEDDKIFLILENENSMPAAE